MLGDDNMYDPADNSLGSGVERVETSRTAYLCSDDVVGLPGVGEAKAAQFLRGDMNPATTTYQKFIQGHDVYKANLPLVQLPYPGTPRHTWVPGRPTSRGWLQAMQALGAKTYLAFTNVRGGANTPVMIPLMDRNDEGRRSHYQTIHFAIPGKCSQI